MNRIVESFSDLASEDFKPYVKDVKYQVLPQTSPEILSK
jgi:hypothetical protein